MGNANSGGPRKTDVEIRHLYELYQSLGSLRRVAEKVGLTAERVRQLLEKGNRRKVCQYSGQYRMCAKLPYLAEAFQTAESWEEVSRFIGYGQKHRYQGGSATKKLCRKFGISTHRQRQFRANRRARLLRQCRIYMEMFHTPLLSSTILQRTAAGHAFYESLRREFGSIKHVRRQLGLPIIEIKGTKRAKGTSAEQATLKHLAGTPLALGVDVNNYVDK